MDETVSTPQGAVVRWLVLRAAIWVTAINCVLGGTIGCAAPAQGRVSIVSYGAIPDGVTDCTAAINEAINAARSTGRSIFVPPGTFAHRSFSIDGVGMAGVAGASTLLARRPDDSNIYLRGSSASLHDLNIVVRSSHRDSRNFAVVVDGADHFVIDSVSIVGGNAGGILDFGGSDGRIVHNRVQNTLADAIHNTHGAHDVVIAANTVRRAGDDMIAVVSYQGEALSHDILIEANDLSDQNYGRGISVVGGENVTIRDNRVARTNCCAGIYIASEANWKTASVDNVLVRRNALTDNSGSTGHGAIMVFAEKNSVRNVSVEDNTVIRARHSAITVLGNASRISIIGNRFYHPAEVAISGDYSNMKCARNLQDGQPADGPSCGGQGGLGVTGASLAVGK